MEERDRWSINDSKPLKFQSGSSFSFTSVDSVWYSPWLDRSALDLNRTTEVFYDWLLNAVSELGKQEELKQVLGSELGLVCEVHLLSSVDARSLVESEAVVAEALNRLLSEREASTASAGEPVRVALTEVNDPNRTSYVQLGVATLEASLQELTKESKRLEDEGVEPLARDNQPKEAASGQLTMPQAFQMLEHVEDELATVRERLRPDVQKYLDAVVAASTSSPAFFPSLKEKQEFARSLQTILDRLGLRLCCPRCKEPATLVARGDRRSGRFTLAHADGSHHFGGQSLPGLHLINQPASKRIHR